MLNQESQSSLQHHFDTFEANSSPSMDIIMNNLVDSMDNSRQKQQENQKSVPSSSKGSYRSLISKRDRLNVLGALGGLGLRSNLRKVDLSETQSSPVLGGDLSTSRDDLDLKDVLKKSEVITSLKLEQQPGMSSLQMDDFCPII